MRLTPLSLAFALSFASLSTAGNGQSIAPINPLSVELVQQGRAAEQSASYTDAIDAYESALVADPRNTQAILGLASVARAQGLPGKAISFYREALLLDPNDTTALSGIGMAYVDKGALEQASKTLARLDELCTTECTGQGDLRSAIAGKARTAQSSQTIENRPISSTESN